MASAAPKPGAGGGWLNAWVDPVANAKAFSSLLCTADLNADGDYKLLVADLDRKLKVYKGTSMMSEHPLFDVPTAMCAFYMDNSSPRVPVVAVACGSQVFIYRSLRPYVKFSLPSLPVDESESVAWASVSRAPSEGGFDAQRLHEVLGELQQRGVPLTARSVEFLAITDPFQRADFAVQTRGLPLAMQTVITCMTVLKKAREEDTAQGYLVLGSESGHVHLLEANALGVSKRIAIKGVPAFMVSQGVADVEYRIFIACRHGCISIVKNGELSGVAIELDSVPVGLVRVERGLAVACMNRTLTAYQLRGKKTHTVYLPRPPVCLATLEHETYNLRAQVVALDNGDIQVYHEKNLVSTIPATEPVSGIYFGPFGRETASLVVCYTSGALAVKILSRSAAMQMTNAAISNSSSAAPSQAAEGQQDTAFPLPKKSKLYIEQTQRERQNASAMYQIFQRDLYKLRLTAARAYVKVLSAAQGPMTHGGSVSIRLGAQVNGIGPTFKLRLALENTGSKPVFNVPITFGYNHSIYRVGRPLIRLPMLVPGIETPCETTVECLVKGAADSIRIFVCNPNQSVLPLITYVVSMPASDVMLDELLG